MTRVCRPARTVSLIFFVGPARQTHVPPLPFQIGTTTATPRRRPYVAAPHRRRRKVCCLHTLLHPLLCFTPPRRRCLSAVLHPRATACAAARRRRRASSSHLTRAASPAPRSHPLARTRARALHLPLSVFCARQVFDVLPPKANFVVFSSGSSLLNQGMVLTL